MIWTLNWHRPLRLSSQLPLATQHDLLQHVQYLLEDMCQQYGMKWCLEEMQQRRWTEPRSLELQCWVKFVKKQPSSLPASLREPQAQSLGTPLFTKVAKIRHLGVHRCALELPALLDYLTAACTFAKLHQDTKTRSQLSSIHYTLQNIYQDLTERQAFLQEALQHKIVQIRPQQGELEHQARADTEQDNSRALTEAGSQVASILRDGPRSETDISTLRDRSSFSDGSEIEAILMEAAILSSVS